MTARRAGRGARAARALRAVCSPAVFLGVLAGGVVGFVVVAWVWLVVTAAGLREGAPRIPLDIDGWALFWVGLSLGFVAGFGAAARAWYRSSGRIEARARREAVAEAEAVLRETTSHGNGSRRD